MAEFRRQDWSAILKIPQDNIDILDLGERGELVARTLLATVYGHSMDRERVPEGFPKRYGKGCSVVTFIEELFAAKHAQQVLDRYPNNVSAKTTSREASENATVRFTHFAKRDGYLEVDTNAMLIVFIRGMAFVIKDGEDFLDKCIPVPLGNGVVCKANMTYLTAHVRRRRAFKAAIVKYSIDTTDVGLFSESSEETPGSYMSLVMELPESLPEMPVPISDDQCDPAAIHPGYNMAARI